MQTINIKPDTKAIDNEGTVYRVERSSAGNVFLRGSRGALYMLCRYAREDMRGLYFAFGRTGQTPRSLRNVVFTLEA